MKLSKVNNINPDKRTYNPNDLLILNRRDIGIEIELEGWRGNDTSPPYWTLVNDGSLRNGVELVSSVIRGDDVIKALDEAQKFCVRNGAIFSDRCSVHIHLDVRHLDTQELLRIVSTYIIFEKFFFDECGNPDREMKSPRSLIFLSS